MKKKLLSFMVIMMILLAAVLPAAAAESIPAERQLPRLVDSANLLSELDEKNLLAKLDEISERQQIDIAVVTVNSLKGKTPQDYADDFYDYNGYGMGTNDDGILLLLSMEERDWRITTHGSAITMFTDAGQKYLSEQFLPDLSDGNYFNAFNRFAELCDTFTTQAKNGTPYDNGNLPKGPVPPLWLLGAFISGGIIALIIVSKMKSDLKTVRKQDTASQYIRQDSLRISNSKDLFLYSKVDMRKKPEPDSSSGSTTHNSSSGNSHGGSGGKF